jgi:hypothetical protein
LGIGGVRDVSNSLAPEPFCRGRVIIIPHVPILEQRKFNSKRIKLMMY